mmetsp:Transcript_56723/g.182151  ORF Transcript_56723/g.182151 Transcript_56723/m.182151 type:complete len:289 (-) Transcript_56723:264-1130(-)
MSSGHLERYRARTEWSTWSWLTAEAGSSTGSRAWAPCVCGARRGSWTSKAGISSTTRRRFSCPYWTGWACGRPRTRLSPWRCRGAPSTRGQSSRPCCAPWASRLRSARPASVAWRRPRPRRRAGGPRAWPSRSGPRPAVSRSWPCRPGPCRRARALAARSTPSRAPWRSACGGTARGPRPAGAPSATAPCRGSSWHPHCSCARARASASTSPRTQLLLAAASPSAHPRRRAYPLRTRTCSCTPATFRRASTTSPPEPFTPSAECWSTSSSRELQATGSTACRTASSTT